MDVSSAWNRLLASANKAKKIEEPLFLDLLSAFVVENVERIKQIEHDTKFIQDTDKLFFEGLDNRISKGEARMIGYANAEAYQEQLDRLSNRITELEQDSVRRDIRPKQSELPAPSEHMLNDTDVANLCTAMYKSGLEPHATDDFTAIQCYVKNAKALAEHIVAKDIPAVSNTDIVLMHDACRMVSASVPVNKKKMGILSMYVKKAKALAKAVRANLDKIAREKSAQQLTEGLPTHAEQQAQELKDIDDKDKRHLACNVVLFRSIKSESERLNCTTDDILDAAMYLFTWYRIAVAKGNKMYRMADSSCLIPINAYVITKLFEDKKDKE